MNITEKKKLVIFRFYAEVNDKLKEKAKEDGLSLQKVAEVIFDMYLRGNKEVMKYIVRRAGEKAVKKNSLDQTEREQLFHVIETKYSPLKDLDSTIKDLEDEDEI